MVNPDDIERAALRAWPAAEEVRVGDWLARFASGYTKRANSATRLSSSGSAPPEADIEACELLFVGRGLAPTFRITSFVDPLADVALETRGYARLEPTLVLHADLTTSVGNDSSKPLELEPVSTWLRTYHALSGGERPFHPEHERILARISSPTLPAVLRDHVEIVSCGLGVIDGDHLGIFDLVTALPHRNRGFASALVAAMISRAKERGARSAYLQVLETNGAALNVYRRFGFQELYRYWYRVPARGHHTW